MSKGTQRMGIKEYKELLANGQSDKKRQGKYNSCRTIINGKSFDSKMEGNYYLELLGRKLAKEIKYFLMQVPLQLAEDVKLVYRCDFMVVHNDNTIDFIDVKGKETKEFRLKCGLVEPRYGIDIILIKDVVNHLKNIAVNNDGSFTCVEQHDFMKYRIRGF